MAEWAYLGADPGSLTRSRGTSRAHELLQGRSGLFTSESRDFAGNKPTFPQSLETLEKTSRPARRVD